MKVLICGGRTFGNRAFIREKLDSLHETSPITYVITGGASGADREGFLWAKSRNIKTYIYQAEWSRYGRAAGMIRNKKMLEKGKPDAVICFPGGNGTAHMRAIALEHVVNVIDFAE